MTAKRSFCRAAAYWLAVLFCCHALADTVTTEKLTANKKTRPNFLIIVSDDHSWAHTSKAGYPYVKTPNFDRIANEGIYFSHAYAAAGTGTASRSALLTGRHIWNTESAALFWGTWPKGLATFQERLKAEKYKVGFTGSGWAPGVPESKGRIANPAGDPFNKHKLDKNSNLTWRAAASSLAQRIVHGELTAEKDTGLDLAANLDDFLSTRRDNQPFSFWVGFNKPHEPFDVPDEPRFGDEEGKSAVPGFLPNKRHVQRWMSAYLAQIESMDADVGKLLAVLEQYRVLNNTIVIITAGNGMGFPHAKATNYEYGVRVPLAIRWGAHIDHPGRTDDAMISLVDIAPTILDAAGAAPLPDMAGSSLLPVLASAKYQDTKRTAIFTAFERHSPYRQGTLTYPRRAIHTAQYAFIRNYFSGRWPGGDEPYFGDVSLLSLLSSKVNGKPIEPYFTLATAKVPHEELYDLTVDPFEMHNVIDDAKYQAVRAQLSGQLDTELVKTHDPMHESHTDYFARFPYRGSNKYEDLWIKNAEKR